MGVLQQRHVPDVPRRAETGSSTRYHHAVNVAGESSALRPATTIYLGYSPNRIRRCTISPITRVICALLGGLLG